jgi:hypothetical protein
MTSARQPDLDAVARAILDANHYMILDPDAAPDRRTPVAP